MASDDKPSPSPSPSQSSSVVKQEAAILYTIQQVLLDHFPQVEIDIRAKRLVVRGAKTFEQELAEKEQGRAALPPGHMHEAATFAAADATATSSEQQQETVVIVDQFGQIVQCDNNEALRRRMEIVMKRVYLALFPMPSLMGCLDECGHGGHHHHGHGADGDGADDHHHRRHIRI